MICLFDLGAEFWRNYFATKSDVAAYEFTIERAAWYRDQYPQFAVCCDSRSKRCEWYPEYKANRDEKPPDALASLRAIEQQIESWGVPVLRCEGYEADDIIATLVDQACLDDVRIVSCDKDLYQLINDRVRLLTKKAEVGELGCFEKFGVHPLQMRDWLALVGDAADNVPGCPNCGPGRARDLLAKFGTLPAILNAKDDEILAIRGVGDKTLASLREWDPTLAVRLVTLLTDAPVDLSTLWDLSALDTDPAELIDPEETTDGEGCIF